MGSWSSWWRGWSSLAAVRPAAASRPLSTRLDRLPGSPARFPRPPLRPSAHLPLRQAFEWIAGNARQPAVVSMSVAGDLSPSVNEAARRLVEDHHITLVCGGGAGGAPACSALVRRVGSWAWSAG